jgi:nucleotidyltransferase AbiEii toxin of type IV toxin-antitoxin system
VRAQSFWKTVTMDDSDLLHDLISLLDENQARYCVIGGQAVSAYAEPLVSLDLDIVIADEDLARVEALCREVFTVERFPHSINLSKSESDLRVQIQTDPRYFSFTEHASPKTVLGVTLPVARVEDVLQGKIWAVSDHSRRGSKRQKDLADIARLLEGYPDLRDQVPTSILDLLV